MLAKYTMSSPLLIDLDGVVLRSPRLTRHIADRATNHVRRQVGLKTYQNAKHMNDKLYATYGHTWLGLSKMGSDHRGRPTDMYGTLEDYHRFVYDDTTLSMAHEVLCGPEGRALRTSLAPLMDVMAMGVSVYLFTNAPAVWAKLATETLGLDIPKEAWWTGEKGLKPECDTYDAVHAWLASRERMEDPLLFIDDTLGHLRPVMHHPKWTPLWWREEIHHDDVLSHPLAISASRNVRTITSWTDVKRIVKRSMRDAETG